jgi:hypothetical protein
MAAMVIGRVISGVYNKVMNFRSIDPGDPRVGLSSINQIDHTVWEQFVGRSSPQDLWSLLSVDVLRLAPLRQSLDVDVFHLFSDFSFAMSFSSSSNVTTVKPLT